MVCSIDVSLAMVLSHWVWWRLRRLREARLRRQRTTPGRKIAMDSQGGGGTPPLPDMGYVVDNTYGLEGGG